MTLKINQFASLVVAIFAMTLGAFLFYFFYQTSLQITASKPEYTFIIKAEKKKGKQIVKEFSNQLEQTTERAFNRTINYLTLILTFFSLALTLFLIFTGFFAFNRIKEINHLIQEAQHFPEKMIHVYYERQLHIEIKNLFHDDFFIRGTAIRNLILNPVIGGEYFDIVKKAIDEEYKKKDNTDFGHNSYDLTRLLLKTNYSQGIDYLFKVISRPSMPDEKLYLLLQFIITSRETEHIQKIKEFLEKDGELISNYSLSALITSRNMISEFADHILEHCSSELISSFLTKIDLQDFQYAPERGKLYLLKNNKLNEGDICSLLRKNSITKIFTDKQKADILLIKLLASNKDGEKLDMSLACLELLSNDETEAEKAVLSIKTQNMSNPNIVYLHNYFMSHKLTTISDLIKKYLLPSGAP